MGAAFAELVVRPQAPPRARGAVFALGALAANFPDVDLVYTGITPEPLGYLLHHRGHTHTVLGLLPQALLLAALAAIPRWRAALEEGARRGRLAALVAAGLLSHLLMDGWNSYGVHPFAPLDVRWLYGDAVFIFEPWLWLLLGTAAALNARRRPWRVGLGVLLAVLVAALAAAGLVPAAALALLGLGVTAFALATRGRTPRARSAVALGACAVLVALLHALGHHVRGHVERAAPGPLADVVLNPSPAAPWCWSFITVAADERDLTLRRGSVSLWPWLQPPETCPAHRLARLGVEQETGETIAWADTTRTPLAALRGLASTNCSVRAWLQFGRAPVLRDGVLLDLRFEAGPRGNFTAMPVPATDACPPALTGWGLPRADVLF